MARTKTIEGQVLWQLGGAEEDSRLLESDRHLRLAYGGDDDDDDDDDEEAGGRLIPPSDLRVGHQP